MTPRRLTAVIGVIAIVLLVMAAFSKRWLVADVRSPEMNGALRIGLTGVQACIATVEISRCEALDWSQVHGLPNNVHVTGSSWMWLGRFTFVLTLLAAVALAALVVIAATDRDSHLPIPRIATWLCLAILPFMGGYYALTPDAFSSIAAGRGFAFAGLGAIAGVIAAFRETRDDFS